jgi:RHS repeat-associated protein
MGCLKLDLLEQECKSCEQKMFAVKNTLTSEKSKKNLRSVYLYGFNGKETDTETDLQDYGMRIYNPSLGRFLSVDPLTKQYPELTPYQFASNSPIMMIDLDGLEGVVGLPGYSIRSATATSAAAKRLVNETELASLKALFTDQLPKDLLDHYVHGYDKYLTAPQMEQVRAAPTGIEGITANDQASFSKLLSTMRPGESRFIVRKIEGAATEGGTLGRFEIQLMGTLTVDKNDPTKWEFTGLMRYYDVYDFKTDKAADGGLQRTDWGDTQTDLVDKTLTGKGFKVYSPWVKVHQTSGDQHFDWFKSRMAQGKQNEISNNPKEVKKIQKAKEETDKKNVPAKK